MTGRAYEYAIQQYVNIYLLHNQHVNTKTIQNKYKEGVGRIAPCCHLPFSRFLFMQKDDKKKLISPKNFQGQCKPIGCSKTPENKP